MWAGDHLFSQRTTSPQVSVLHLTSALAPAAPGIGGGVCSGLSIFREHLALKANARLGFLRKVETREQTLMGDRVGGLEASQPSMGVCDVHSWVAAIGTQEVTPSYVWGLRGILSISSPRSAEFPPQEGCWALPFHSTESAELKEPERATMHSGA